MSSMVYLHILCTPRICLLNITCSVIDGLGISPENIRRLNLANLLRPRESNRKPFFFLIIGPRNTRKLIVDFRGRNIGIFRP